MISSLSSSTSATADFFSRIDTNSDGQATADELKADFESRIKKAATSTTSSTSGTSEATPDFVTMVSEGDSDGDGTLSEVEFTTAMQARHQMPPPPPPSGASPSTDDESSDESSLEQAISSIDTDGDGKLSAAELAAAYLARTEATDETETDESENSTTAESTTASTSPDFESLVALVDTDGDGLLNSDELSTLVSDSRRAQQPPPPPPATPPERAWAPDADTTSTSDIGQA